MGGNQEVGGGVEIRTDSSDLCQVNQDPPADVRAE